MKKCFVCGMNNVDVEVNLNTQAGEKPVWFGICFSCEDAYREYTESRENNPDTYQTAPKEF